MSINPCDPAIELARTVSEALETNGGPIDHADTVDGKSYVMVEMDAFNAMQDALKIYKRQKEQPQ